MALCLWTCSRFTYSDKHSCRDVKDKLLKLKNQNWSNITWRIWNTRICSTISSQSDLIKCRIIRYRICSTSKKCMLHSTNFGNGWTLLQRSLSSSSSFVDRTDIAWPSLGYGLWSPLCNTRFPSIIYLNGAKLNTSFVRPSWIWVLHFSGHFRHHCLQGNYHLNLCRHFTAACQVIPIDGQNYLPLVWNGIIVILLLLLCNGIIKIWIIGDETACRCRHNHKYLTNNHRNHFDLQ